MTAPRLRSVQVGMGWQLEEAGGLNRLFRALSASMPGAGVEFVGLVAGSARAEAESNGAVRAFAASRAPMWRRVLAARRRVRAAIASSAPTVLVSHFAPYGLSLLGAARRLPLVSYFHGPWAAESRNEGRGAFSHWLRQRIERRVYTRSVACIVLSRAFGDLLARDYGVRPELIHVIPGGVDVARFASLPARAEARRTLGWAPDAPTVLCVRRLVKRTGVDRLVAAAALLKARHPNARIMIAGDGPERAALASQAASLGLDGMVRFLGLISEEELRLAYRAADLTVVPTIALEGFGLIVPESLAAGTPCLVTPVGGLPEVVAGLSSNLVMRDATPESIAAALGDAIAAPASLPNAEQCATFARARYDWPVIARQVADLLRRVHAEHAGHSGRAP